MTAAPRPPVILLVEPQFVLRRTILALARDFGVGIVLEASSAEAAAPLLARTRFDGAVLDFANTASALTLLERLRGDEFETDAGIPVVGTTGSPLGSIGARVEALALTKLLMKPFKVGDLLEVMRQMPVRSS